MRWVLRLAGLLVFVLLLAVAALALVPGERIAGIAAERFTASTGRELRILGEVRPSLWPEIGVATGGVEIDGRDGVPMLSARALSVGVDPIGLLSGDIRIRGIDIDGADLRLAVDAEGRGNWETDGAGPGAGGGATIPDFTLDRLNLRDGRVSFTDADGVTTTLEDLTVTAALPDAAGPADLDLSARTLGLDVRASARISSVADLLSGVRTPLEFSVSAGGAEARFSGSATSSGVVDGDIAVTVPEPAALPGLAALPTGLGAERIELQSGLAVAGDSLALAGLVATLDGNRITGAVDVALGGARPRLEADLDLGAFDLATVETPSDEAGDGTGWSTDPIDVSFLDLVDGRIRVTADSLALGTARLGATDLTTRVEDRRAVTTINRLVAYDGSVGGEVVLNGRGGFSTRMDVAGSALAISRLLSELVGYDRLIAAGDLRLDVLGSGPHMQAVMDSLSGEGAFDIGAGELIGLDIVGMIRNLDTSFVGDTRRTIFDEITVSFRIVDGVVIYDDLAVNAPLFRATGIGEIGLGAQTLDMRLTPELLGGEAGGLAVPVTIRGTWDAPRIGLDLENLVRRGLESEIGEELQREGAERLGVTVDEGQSVEDAVRGRIEEELREGLGGLLGR